MGIFKKDLSVLIERAETLARQGEWQQATKAWQAVLGTYKRTAPPKTYARLSYAFRKIQDYEKARSIIDRGLRKYPEYLPLYIEHAYLESDLRDWPTAAQSWQVILKKFPDTAPAAVWTRLIQAYRVQSKLSEAEAVAQTASRKYPENTDLKIECARLAVVQERWQEATKLWLAVKQKTGDQAPIELWVKLALAQRKMGNTHDAEITVSQGLSKYPARLELLTERAEISTAKGDWLEALKHWQAVLHKLEDDNESPRLYARLHISVINRLVDLDNYKQQIKEYRSGRDLQKPTIAIVTSVTKGYDVIMPHEVLDKRFDYIVYTDAKFDDMGIYDVRPLLKPDMDGARSIRFVKTHPHSLLSEYDLVVWLDTSLMIVGDIFPILDAFMKSGKAIGANVHPLRKSVREEFEACIARKKGNVGELNRQMDYYRKIGFLEHGLAECGFLAFNLRDKRELVSTAMETWWEQICRFSARDQLSFTYALAQHDVEWYPLTKPPQGVRKHPHFILTTHHTEYKVLDHLINLLSNSS